MNKSLRELVSTDRRFQSSVNLLLDINNEEKIEGYIPTRSSLNILEQYLNDIEDNSHGNATVLIGPYGKGKSHLVLVWLALLAGNKTGAKDKLIKKISSIDKNVGQLSDAIYRAQRKYLPVLVSNTELNLNQAFLISLYESLQKNNLSEIMPESYYSEAVKVINNWKGKFPNTYREFEFVLAKENMSVAEFEQGLKNFDKSKLTFFRSIYPSLTAGSRFEPILQQEAIKVYQSIVRELREQYGYDGIALVFDEFSKYIEGHSKESFSSDMRVLQEMCELAAGSKNEDGRIQLVLIAHKSIKEYGVGLDDARRKAYEGVEGRIQERLFVISGQNNYELIKNTIKKEKTANEIFSSEGFEKIVDKSYELQVFRGVFDKESEFRNVIAEGCFPLLPLATYLLLGISEKVAQNERTIFTFLCYDEYGSLTNIISKHKKGDYCFVAADAVYDYFEIQFKENVSDIYIHNEWLKADYALSKTETDDEKKVVKAIALVHMLAKYEELIADEKTIELAVGHVDGLISDILKKLEEKQLIIYRPRTNQYAFRHNVGIDLDKEIKNKIAGLQNRYSISDVVAEIAEMDYLLPRRHNQSYKMTRYFRYLYFTEDEFLAVPDVSTMFAGTNFADGCIACVLIQDVSMRDKCIEKTKKLNDSRVLTILPKEQIEIANYVKKYLAIKELLSSAEFLAQHQVMKQELSLQLEDVIYEINAILEKAIGIKNSDCDIYHEGTEVEDIHSPNALNNFLSGICDTYYKDTPIINHELVNIRRVSGQYLKARNNVIDAMLNGDNLEQYISGTSPESMVFRSSLLYTGIYSTKEYVMDPGTKAVIGEIHKFFKKAAGEKRSFDRLFNKLQGKGCGMRAGVIPIYIASQLVTLGNMPVIYLLDKEIDVTAEILNNLCQKPEEYFLYIEAKDASKDKYLQDLEQLFIDEEFSRHIQEKHKRLSTLVNAMQRWYMSLPQCAMHFNDNEVICDDDEMERIKAFRNIFRKLDINPREVLFDTLPRLLSNEDLQECTENIKSLHRVLEGFLKKKRGEAVYIAKKTLGFKDNEGLASGLINWYRSQSEFTKKYINSSKVSQLMNYIASLNSYDDELVVSDLSKILIDLYIEDWVDSSLSEFAVALKDAIETIDKISDSKDSSLGEYTFTFKDSNGELVERNYDFAPDDSTSYFLKNAIESALDDFGDSLETNQKVAVLVQTIEQLIKQK